MTAQYVASRMLASPNPVRGLWAARDRRNRRTPMSAPFLFWSEVAAIVYRGL